MKLYENEINPTVVFEGNKEECRKWLLDHVQGDTNGRKIFRFWTNENGVQFIDVGPVFFAYEEIFTANN